MFTITHTIYNRQVSHFMRVTVNVVLPIEMYIVYFIPFCFLVFCVNVKCKSAQKEAYAQDACDEVSKILRCREKDKEK